MGRVLSIILVIAILGALGMLGYVIAAPKTAERFTEFYMLGLSGNATGYPQDLRVGEEGKVIIDIVNHQQETTSYRIEVRIDGEKYNETGRITLDNGERWEGIVSFAATTPGDNRRVEFFLYRNDDTAPLLKPLFLLINVAK